MCKNDTNLRFNGSLWCNLDVALRNMDQVFRQSMYSLGLSVIEMHVLRALYEQDGQHASKLAQSVGRAATSFTPNLDKLQRKGLIERRPDDEDRRAVRIHLTQKAYEIKNEINAAKAQVDEAICNMVDIEDFEAFTRVIHSLQSLESDEL